MLQYWGHQWKNKLILTLPTPKAEIPQRLVKLTGELSFLLSTKLYSIHISSLRSLFISKKNYEIQLCRSFIYFFFPQGGKKTTFHTRGQKVQPMFTFFSVSYMVYLQHRNPNILLYIFITHNQNCTNQITNRNNTNMMLNTEHFSLQKENMWYIKEWPAKLFGSGVSAII